MKKILAFITALMIFGIPVLAAPYAPLPISGMVTDVYGSPANGIEVTILNERTGDTVITYTASDGSYLAEWANTPSKYANNDVFKISIPNGQSKEVAYSASSIDVVADFNGVTPECPAPIVCPTCDACQTCPTCDVCTECPTCPAPTTDWQTIVGSLIVGGVITGIGIKASKSKTTGKVTVAITQHKHAGIASYHSINTMHMNPMYRHKKGDINPKFTVDGKPFPTE